MTPEGGLGPVLPVPVEQTLDEFRVQLDLEIHVWAVEEDGSRARHLYPYDTPEAPPDCNAADGCVVKHVAPKEGPPLELEVRSSKPDMPLEPLATILKGNLERTLDLSQEIHFFTYEVSERYAEIDLLYTISETLGSVVEIGDAAERILEELCDVLGAERGSLWVHDPRHNLLCRTAAFGENGAQADLCDERPDTVTAQVFAEGRSRIGGRTDLEDKESNGTITDISVPISYSPPSGEARTVGVINLFGRKGGDPFAIGDEKLLSAIASQIGAALENNRLIQDSLAQERMSHEMELAHHLQMKLLKSPETFDGADVAARVASAEQVGGDFFHLFKLPQDKIGVMIGDVSTHGFPAALIMALSMSAASIRSRGRGAAVLQRGPPSCLRIPAGL